MHTCLACGLVLGRDANAALNILRLALIERPGWGLQVGTVGVARAVA
jgi:transposase